MMSLEVMFKISNIVNLTQHHDTAREVNEQKIQTKQSQENKMSLFYTTFCSNLEHILNTFYF